MRHIAGRYLKSAFLAGAVLSASFMSGCEVDSFFDPSKTGRFEHYPTLIPILDRIDVIEGRGEFWGQTTAVTPEDLLPSDLTYRLGPGDAVTVEVFELLVPGQIYTSTRRIDAIGNYRIATLGDLPAAGLTAQQFQEVIEEAVRKQIANPVITVQVEEGVTFEYTVYGFVVQPGQYQLRRPDFRLLDALAIAGGTGSPGTDPDNIYVIRRVPLTPDVMPFEKRRPTPDEAANPPANPPQQPPVDLEELIRQLDKEKNSGDVQPGILRMDSEPVIDIDQLEPVQPVRPQVDIEEQAPAPTATPADPTRDDSFIFLPERGEWVRVRSNDPRLLEQDQMPEPEVETPGRLFVQRIIEVPIKKLKQGDSSYNLVIRPGDAIYVKEPEVGVVYIDGEIFRPGVFNLDPSGGLTLSRLVAAAGGPAPLAFPDRVDLVRMVDDNRQAIVRVNLAAIRAGTEPDIYLKANDHIIMGTSWLATPLAIFRNGLRMTYGFGIVLDRNFGNDVFGAPPTNRFGE